jgi:diguanylate cyclase (GGDEF)-like protein
VLGVLVVGWTDPAQALDARGTELVRMAADEAACALQRRAALRRLESAALNDALTGVPNRRAFDEELPRALARAVRSDEPLALATMDLNGFKALNDREGHTAGDRVLKEVAAAWQAELRQTDLLARVGGDEFSALLPGCGADDLDTVAERLRAAVVHAPGCGLGIVHWDGVESAASLVRRADEALYADKARGSRARLSDPVRLAALNATGLLDAPPQPELDELTRVVTWLLDVPAATISLVDDHRQFFAGQCGLTGPAAEARGTPLSTSFCQHTVAAGRPLIVSDAREVPLLRDNPAIAERGVIAYAGIPLVDADDNVLGVLCAIDHRPRDWSDDDIATLRGLARRAIGELAGRRA